MAFPKYDIMLLDIRGKKDQEVGLGAAINIHSFIPSSPSYMQSPLRYASHRIVRFICVSGFIVWVCLDNGARCMVGEPANLDDGLAILSIPSYMHHSLHFATHRFVRFIQVVSFVHKSRWCHAFESV
jgi:hypothetical protein